MAIYQLKTFLDIITTVLDETKVQAGDTNNYNRIKRDVNIGYQDIVSRKNWRWLDRDIQVNHLAYVATGTIAATQNSAAITFSSAPSISVAGYYISLDGDSEVYQIDTHTAASTSAVLKTVFIGTTSTAAAYKLWADAIPLPTNVSETKVVRLDGSPEPLTPLGLSDIKRLAAMNPKASGPPMFYATTDYMDPTPYAAVTSLPATATRASAGLTKTIKFAAGISSYLAVGDRLKITTAGENSYNGEIEISAISTTTNASDTITYTGLTRLSEASTTDTSITVTMLGQKIQGEKYRQLVLYPSLSSDNRLLHVDYVTSVQPLEEDTDEPLMPIEDRLILVYYGLYRTWSRMRNPEEATKNLALYEKKLNQMIGKLVDSKEKASLQPSRSYLKRKRSSPGSTNGGAGFFFESFGGTGSDTTIVAGANKVAIFDTIGNLNYSSSISTTELGYLDGVTSNIQDQLNGVMTDTLQNGYIFIGDATDHAAAQAVSGDITINSSGVTAISAGVIVDADVNASAAITRSKLATGTAYRIVANNSSGTLSENAAITASRAVASDANGQLVASATTATELGYVNGVTSAIQTQLDAKMTNALTSANIFVGNGSNVATGVAVTGDIGLTNAGVASISSGVIVDADVNASAGITRSKTATGTAYRVLANNSSGVMSENAAITASRAVASDANGQLVAATTTATELGYVNGVTGAIQTQLDAKQSTTLADGKFLVGNGSNVATAVTLTGDVTSTNAGVTAIGANKVTLAQEAQIATASFKGRTTAGTGNVEVLTATQATALLNNVVGDSGSGGTKGLVPAPAAGDAAASKFLKADGTWTALSGLSSTLTDAHILVGNGSNVATDVAVTGDISITNAGVTAIASGVIVNADVNASAAIDYSKLASMTSASILLGNGSNVPTVTAVTGDVTINNTGVTAIGANKVTLAQEAQMATASFKGRTTAGTGNVEVLTATQATAILNNMVGDSGSGGTKGLVPAPAAGDAAAGKFLKADGTWAAGGVPTLTDAHIFVGNASNTATDVAVTGDISITNAGVTAIASGVIVNADVNASAAIDYSKLAALTSANILVGNASNVATVTAVTGDIGITNAGVTSISSGVIVNADVNASAAIDRTKIASGTNYRILANSSSGVMSENAAITASRAVASDANGQLVAATTTATELGYVNGVTSAIQTQLDAKLSTTLSNGTVLIGNGSNVATAVTLTGDVTTTNAGVTAIGSNKVTLGQMAQVATATFLGRTTAATGNVEALTVTQATALLNNVVGDSGSGGTKGLVPAPASGDAAANKFLKADGTWSAPSGTGDVTGPASSTDNAIVRFDLTTGKLIQNTSLATLDDDGAAVIGRKTFSVTSTPLSVVTATHKNGVLLVDTSATGANAAVSINLPTPAVGITFTVKDNGNYFGTNKCTLVRSGSEKIGLLSSSFDLESSGGSWEIYCNGTDWFIG